MTYTYSMQNKKSQKCQHAHSLTAGHNVNNAHPTLTYLLRVTKRETIMIIVFEIQMNSNSHLRKTEMLPVQIEWIDFIFNLF